MTKQEFDAIFTECGEEVADKLYPKNDTAAQGGAPTPRRGEFLRDLGVLAAVLTDRFKQEGIIT
jgi:hypothetical protein